MSDPNIKPPKTIEDYKALVKSIAGCVSYEPEEDSENEAYDENYCVERDTLLGVQDDIRAQLYWAGIKIPTEC